MPRQLLLGFGNDLQSGDVAPVGVATETRSRGPLTEDAALTLKPQLLALFGNADAPIQLCEIQAALGHPAPYMAQNPSANPVNLLVKQMRDLGELVVGESRFGSPMVSLPKPAAVSTHRETSGDNAEPAEASDTFNLIRPDRQFTFDGLPVNEWLEPAYDPEAITVDRPHDDIDGPAHRFFILCGDSVEVLLSKEEQEHAVLIGTVIEVDHLRRRVLVRRPIGDDTEEAWCPVERVFPVVDDSSNTRRGRCFQLRDERAESPAYASSKTHGDNNVPLASNVEPPPPYTFEQYRRYRERFDGGTVTAAELKDEFQRLRGSREPFVIDLKKRFDANQLKALAARFGCFNAKRNSKEKNARHVWGTALQSFSLDGSVRYNPLGGQTLEHALAEQVDAITDEKLQEVFAAQKRAEADEQQAMRDPQTVEQFAVFIRRRGLEELVPKQRFRFEQLHADKTRSERKAKTKATVEQICSDGAGELQITIKEGWHDHERVPLWICQLSERVDRSTFTELKTKAKQLGGWYSSFKKADAGFQFRNRESAAKFQQLLSGEIDRSDELAARKACKMESASERLTAVAQTLEAEAEDILAADSRKLKNTVRRGDRAAGMRGHAYANQAMAGTLRSIAAALATGDAIYLDGVRARTQVETLTALLRRGKTNRNRVLLEEKGKLGVWERHNEYERLDNRSFEQPDTLHVGYPYPSIYKRHLEGAVVVAENRRGVKQQARKMRSWLIGDGQFAEFTDEHDTHVLIDFVGRCKAVGIETQWIESGLEDYKRLRAANIHTPQEMRSALRELIPHLRRKEEDDPVTKLEQQLIGTRIPGFFPTPKPIISRMLELADIQPGDCILEPSAGKGDILDMVRSQHPHADVIAIEINTTLQEILAAKGHGAAQGDFLEHVGTYDKILMNPPFENSADIEHVRHAAKQLNPGGRLIAIMSEGPFFRQDKTATEFREWLEDVDAESEQLPEDAFRGTEAFRQTGVRTRIVSIHLPE